jgi:hypothetical protein
VCQKHWREQTEPIARVAHRARCRYRSTGFTPELVEQLRVAQGGKCAVCGVILLAGIRSAEQECADHDHTDGAPRGLLCRTCNWTLGVYEKQLRDRGVVFAPLEDYLRSTPVSLLPGGVWAAIISVYRRPKEGP